MPVSLFVCDLVSVSEVLDIYSHINMRNFSKHWWIILILGNLLLTYLLHGAESFLRS